MSSNQRATFLCRGKKERETGGQAGMQTDIVKIRLDAGYNRLCVS